MRATRSTLPYLIAAAGGALLFLSLFLSWFSVEGGSASLWEIASGVDIVLAVLGIAAAAIAGARALGSDLPVAWLRPQLLKWIGLIALSMIAEYQLESDNAGFGAFLGLIAALAILGGAIVAERPDLTARLAEATGVPDDQPRAAPPAGLGPSSSGAGPSPPAASATPAPAPPAARTPEPPATAQPPPGAAGAAPGPAAAGPPAGQSSGPPAGWYPDPQGQARLRYWDGSTWTDQTSA